MCRSAVLVWKQLFVQRGVPGVAGVDTGCMFGSWTKVAPLEFTVDSYTCVRHAGTVHPVKDTWDLDERFCFVYCVFVGFCTLDKCAHV